MDREPSLEVGAYVLDLRDEGGVGVRGGSGTADAETASLREALKETAPEEPARAPDLADEVGDAAEATEKVEKAVALCKGVTEGRALSLDQLGLEVGSLLDCLEKLDKKKKHKDSLRMARALATLLMLLKRWADLLQTLRIALRAGEELGDLEAVAWAKHQLGSLRLVAGDLKGADRDLSRARELREQVGDRRGLAATNRNLGVLCEHLREMVRNDDLMERAGSKPSWRYLVAGAAVAAFLFLGGLAVGSGLGDDNAENVANEGVETTYRPNDSDNGTKNTNSENKRDEQNENRSNPSEFPLTVIVEGGGAVTISGEEIRLAERTCEDVCNGVARAGETVTLYALEGDGLRFLGFSGCKGDDPSCSVQVDAPTTVTATYEPLAEISDETEPGATTEPTPEELEEQKQKEAELIPSEEEEAESRE